MVLIPLVVTPAPPPPEGTEALSSAAVSLIPAMGPALVALVAGVVVALITHSLTRSRAYEDWRRQTLFELLSELHTQFNDLMDLLRSGGDTGQTRNNCADLIVRIKMLIEDDRLQNDIDDLTKLMMKACFPEIYPKSARQQEQSGPQNPAKAMIQNELGLGKPFYNLRENIRKRYLLPRHSRFKRLFRYLKAKLPRKSRSIEEKPKSDG